MRNKRAEFDSTDTVQDISLSDAFKFLASMDKNSLKSVQLVLALHAAVDFVHCQGAGVGIVQRAECAATGIIKMQLIPDQERKYGFSREKLVVENIKTPARAYMLAVVRALNLAKGTIKRHSSKAARVQKVTVYSNSPKVVETINHHIKHAPTSLNNVTSTNDRLMIKRVVTGARKLSRQGLEISIVGSSGECKRWERARKLAMQKGRQACRSRRQLQRTRVNGLLGEDKETGEDKKIGEDKEIKGDGIPEGTFDLVIRTKDVPKMLH